MTAVMRIGIAHGRANCLTGGSQWDVKFDRKAGAAADEWSDLVSHLIEGNTFIYISWDMYETCVFMSTENNTKHYNESC